MDTYRSIMSAFGVVGIVRYTSAAMMVRMQIEIVTEIKESNGAVESYLSTVVRPAIAAGINAAAELVNAVLLAELIEDIYNPTSFTRNAFGIMPASSKPGAGGIDTVELVYIKGI